jgi:hypothetical protein
MRDKQAGILRAAGNLGSKAVQAVGRGAVSGTRALFGGNAAVAAGMLPLGLIATGQAAQSATRGFANNYRQSRAIQKGLMEVPLHPSEAPGVGGILGVLKTTTASSPMDDIYVALAQGQLTTDDVSSLEEFSDALNGGQVSLEQNKEAAGGPALNAAATMLGTLGAGALAHGMVRGGKALADDLSFGRDLDAIIRVYPDLRDYPRGQLELLFASLRRVNPNYAKDPVIAGSYLTRMMEARSSFDNPRAMPAIDLDIFKNIAQAGQFVSQQKNDGRMGDVFHNATDRGMEALLAGTRAGAGAGAGRKGR